MGILSTAIVTTTFYFLLQTCFRRGAVMEANFVRQSWVPNSTNACCRQLPRALPPH
jgi:hypothetical protein